MAATPERWQRIQDLLDQSLNLPLDQVQPFLAEQCAGDTELLREVERLHHACQSAESFLADPPALLASALLVDGPAPPPQRIGP